jgi:tRNA-dihydrouridine synthase C
LKSQVSQVSQVILAPMEGVADRLMRQILTSINNYDLCVTEFVRIVDNLLPEHVFYKNAPELLNGGYTVDGTPIRVQLLGQEPQWMAENANRAIELGSHGLDLNFGCPAKTVNKSRGGAVLLKSPEHIYRIVSSVKSALPRDAILSAKIRLGFNDASLLEEIVSAVTTAKADQLTIHARTKLDGYKPPAYWQHIGRMRDKTNIKLVANGEIWSSNDAKKCIIESKTNNIMLGRGALALPNLANVIKLGEAPMPWKEVCQLLIKYAFLDLDSNKRFYFSSRLKQWLRYLKIHYVQADELFKQIKLLKDKKEILPILEALAE